MCPLGAICILHCLRYGQGYWFHLLNLSFPVPFRVHFHEKVSIDEIKKRRIPGISYSFSSSSHIRVWGEWLCKFYAFEKFILRPIILEITKESDISISMWVVGIFSSLGHSSTAYLTLACAMLISGKPCFLYALAHETWLGEAII